LSTYRPSLKKKEDNLGSKETIANKTAKVIGKAK
jgi:hypothetical protein